MSVLPDDLRVVLLGLQGSGKSSAGNTILGLEAFPSQHAADTAAPPQECLRYSGQAAGREVVLVDSADWFSPGCSPEEVRRRVSSFVALSLPGPHAFLLCVPVNRPATGALGALGALERLLAPVAVRDHTIVLFTFADELPEGRSLEEHLTEDRKDLLEVVERCSGRYHALRARRGGQEEKEGEAKAVEELMEKVEHVELLAMEGGEAGYFSCPLFREAKARVRERQAEMVRRRRREEAGGGEEEEEEEMVRRRRREEVGGGEEEVVEEEEEEAPSAEEMEKVRDEVERSVRDLDVDVDAVAPAACLCAPSPPPSFLWGLWAALVGWLRRLPRLVRREALFGSLVGLFVGGPFGGMLGATVGSVATEVGRRKTQKNK